MSLSSSSSAQRRRPPEGRHRPGLSLSLSFCSFLPSFLLSFLPLHIVPEGTARKGVLQRSFFFDFFRRVNVCRWELQQREFGMSCITWVLFPSSQARHSLFLSLALPLSLSLSLFLPSFLPQHMIPPKGDRPPLSLSLSVCLCLHSYNKGPPRERKDNMNSQYSLNLQALH